VNLAASPTRFTFDLDLRRAEERSPYANEADFAAQLQQARMAGYAEGFSAGEQGATAAAARAHADGIARIADDAQALLAGLDATRHAAERDAVELAASIARKLAAHLVAREPTAELEALLVDCLASLDGVPHIVIRCHPDLAQQVRDLATARIAASGFSGRLIVMGDPDRVLSDGRIEWADGGLVRDMAAISTDIDQRIASYLAARQTTPIEDHR
jgi:flagellar assembly protein FliH